MLEFGMKMPFSYSYFLMFAQEQLSRDDVEIIKRVKIIPYEDIDERFFVLKEWRDFDRALRNELARRRAQRKSKDPDQYIRGEYYPEPSIAGFVQWVVEQDSPLEAEISLERKRWEKLDELVKGHYFDIDYLVIYALKLQILERWERINSGMKIDLW